jgi:hypothetical protein
MHLQMEIANSPPLIGYFDRKIAGYLLRIV